MTDKEMRELAAPTGYAASLYCPNCERKELRMQYGAYVCDRCDIAHGHNHIVAWNKGFVAGYRAHERHTEKAHPTAIDLNLYEKAREERQRWMLSQSEQAQEERIAAHYTAFAHLAMQLRELTKARKHGCTTDLNDTIRYLTGKIREGHLMEFGIQLEWPNDQAH